MEKDLYLMLKYPIIYQRLQVKSVCGKKVKFSDYKLSESHCKETFGFSTFYETKQRN